jgi:hypothetical protein
MKAILTTRYVVMLSLLMFTSSLILAQTDKKAVELKKLETSLNAAKAKVALNERKMEVADSLVNAGTQMVSDAKAEIKAITAERKKLDKDYATEQKSASKLSNSKDKDEAKKGKEDLKSLSLKYRADAKVLDTRLSAANKKSTTGEANITKGKAGKGSAKAALKTSNEALDAAQKRYDAATGTEEKTPAKDAKKKK